MFGPKKNEDDIEVVVNDSDKTKEKTAEELDQDLDRLLEDARKTGEENLTESQLAGIVNNIFSQFRKKIFEEKKRKQYKYAYNAFASAVLNGPLNALNKEYEPPKSFWKFLWDLCNRKTLPKIVIATVVGGLAAYFYIPSAMNAADMIADLFHIPAHWTGARNFMRYFMASVGAGENAALGAFSMKDYV